MRPDLYIARRYLVARKSLGVIHTISTLGIAGMAVGTAALILILSIYNGFDSIIRSNLSDLDPDLLVTSARGKYFVPEGAAFESLLDDPRIVRISSVLEEQVSVGYGGRQDFARAKGVDAVYEQESRLAAHCIDGTFALHDGDLPQVAVGAGLAHKMGVSPRFVEPMTLYYPRRGARIPLIGPAAALGSVKVAPGCVFSVNTSVDAELIVLPIDQMRALLGLDEEVSGIELHTATRPSRRLLREVQELLGPDYLVRDRYRQHPTLYKMMRYEKLAIYLILLFVVVIIATNIFGSLSMLVLTKREDIRTLRAIGADDALVRRIFVWEGGLVSLVGLAAGLVLGTGLTLLQQGFGLIKMPGGFDIRAYPVELQAADVLWTVLGVAAIGFLISLLAAPRRSPAPDPR